MHETIAVIDVETYREGTMGGDNEFNRLFKIEIPTGENGNPEDQAMLFEYQNGYAYLEGLGTTNSDEAITEAESRIPDYITNEDLQGMTVKRRG